MLPILSFPAGWLSIFLYCYCFGIIYGILYWAFSVVIYIGSFFYLKMIYFDGAASLLSIYLNMCGFFLFTKAFSVEEIATITAIQ